MTVISSQTTNACVHFVSSEVAAELLRWDEVIHQVGRAYTEPYVEGSVPPRTIAQMGRAWLRCLPAMPPGSRYFGAKLMGASFAPVPGVKGGVQYIIVLFDKHTSRIAGFVDGNLVTAYRTAATSGAALDRLIGRASITLGVLGSGLEAGMHVRAFGAIRTIKSLKVFSPTPARREAFAASIAQELNIPAEAVDSPEAAVADTSVVVAAARSKGEVPILYGDWLKPGMAVVSIGSTVPQQREIDASVVERCDLIVCDVLEEVLHETGDMIEAARQGIAMEIKSYSIHQLMSGELAAKVSAAKIPMFKSVGSGLQDIVVAEHLFTKACERGLAAAVPMEFSFKS